MDGKWQPGDSQPDLAAEVNNESLQEEFVGTSIEEVEKPLLSSVGSVVPDVTTNITFLIVEVVLTIPSLVHHLGYTKTLTVDESHVFGVSEFVMCQTASYKHIICHKDAYKP